MMTQNERKQFEIDQLRKDNIIYAVEAVATNTACLLGYGFASAYLAGNARGWAQLSFVFVGIGYTIYMGIGNARRLMRIKQIEKSLY
jgi:hypothetical protein